MTLTDDGRARVLNNGVRMPLLGFGVWQIPDGPQTEQAVRWALEAGYRHIDTAALYRNEESVGKAVRDGGVPRDELFIATKFQPRDPTRSARSSRACGCSGSITSTSTCGTGRRAAPPSTGRRSSGSPSAGWPGPSGSVTSPRSRFRHWRPRTRRRL